MALRPLRPAQIRALQYALPKARIALFMEMRLGKSAVAIRWATARKLQRVLVVAPNDILEDWREELIREDIPPDEIYVLSGSRLSKLGSAQEVDSGWVIVNYEALRVTRRKNSRTKDIVGASIIELPWSGIILDESVAIRKPSSQTTKTFLGYAGHIGHRAILSGLPNPQGELDYFSQMAFLNGDFMGYHNYWVFRQRFFMPGFTGWDWRPRPNTLALMQREVQKYAFILTRKDAGVGEHRVFERRYVEMETRQRNAYKQVEKEFAYGDLETQWATVKTVWMARIAGGFSPDRERPEVLSSAKTKVLLNLLKTELAKEQVVVWFRFNEELRYVAKELVRAKITHREIVGGQKDRSVNQQYKEDFQQGRARVILIQIKMGKYGWDLSASSTAIYYSMSYDYEEIAQSRDRIVNVAKHEPLLNIYLITRGTIDKDVVDTISEKGMTARLFNSRLKERLRESWDIDYPRSVGRTFMRVIPGDVGK